MPCSWPASQTPQFPLQHGDQRPPCLFIKFRVLPPTVLQVGKALGELRLKPLLEFGGMEVRPLKMVLCAQEDRVLPVPPQNPAGVLGKMRTQQASRANSFGTAVDNSTLLLG